MSDRVTLKILERKLAMDKINVICNRHTRPLYTFTALPKRAQKDFDYVPESEQWDARFFNYLGSWYDFQEFERAPHSVLALGFDGVQPDSYFSATVVAYFDDDGYPFEGEIIVGRIHW